MVQPSDFRPAWSNVTTDQQPTSIPNYDDDEDEISDLNFTTSIDTSVTQDVQMKSSYDPSTPRGVTDTATDQEYGNLNPSSFATTNETTSKSTSTLLSDSSHPFACIFHCLFKLLAIVLYIFGGMFTGGSHSGSRFIIITVFCIILLSADFWVVKNITGRLLVGLRWWNMVSEDGQTTRWIFESAENAHNVNKFDSSVFWGVLYAAPVLWGIFFFIAFLKFELGWLITVAMGLTLSSANVYGYYKCSSDQKAKVQNLMSRGAEWGVGAAIKNNVFGMLSRMGQQGGGGSVEMSSQQGGNQSGPATFTVA